MLKSNECIYCIRHSNISELNLQWKAFTVKTTVNGVPQSPHPHPHSTSRLSYKIKRSISHDLTAG